MILNVGKNASNYRRLTNTRRSLAESALQLLVHRGNYYYWLFMASAKGPRIDPGHKDKID